MFKKNQMTNINIITGIVDFALFSVSNIVLEQSEHSLTNIASNFDNVKPFLLENPELIVPIIGYTIIAGTIAYELYNHYKIQKQPEIIHMNKDYDLIYDPITKKHTEIHH